MNLVYFSVSPQSVVVALREKTRDDFFGFGSFCWLAAILADDGAFFYKLG